MVKTMENLRREVAVRMRNALHGREIDMSKEHSKESGVVNKPNMSHMLGVTPLHEIHDPTHEKGTLLDPRHDFWDNYEYIIETRSHVSEKIETAIRSLQEDDIVNMTYPYGDESDTVYIEVDEDYKPRQHTQTSEREPDMRVQCQECGEVIRATGPSLRRVGNSYNLSVVIDCEHCEYSDVFEQGMVRK